MNIVPVQNVASYTNEINKYLLNVHENFLKNVNKEIENKLINRIPERNLVFSVFMLNMAGNIEKIPVRVPNIPVYNYSSAQQQQSDVDLQLQKMYRGITNKILPENLRLLHHSEQCLVFYLTSQVGLQGAAEQLIALFKQQQELNINANVQKPLVVTSIQFQFVTSRDVCSTCRPFLFYLKQNYILLLKKYLCEMGYSYEIILPTVINIYYTAVENPLIIYEVTDPMENLINSMANLSTPTNYLPNFPTQPSVFISGCDNTKSTQESYSMKKIRKLAGNNYLH